MTTALVVHPERYVEYMRDEEFWIADHKENSYLTPREFGGYSPREDRRVYVHAGLAKEGGFREREAVEERLLLALSLEASPTDSKTDEAQYWTARINLMGWTLTERYDVALIARSYEAQRGAEKWTKVSVVVTDEALRDERVPGMIARKIAYAVWRLWAPEFIWPETS